MSLVARGAIGRHVIRLRAAVTHHPDNNARAARRVSASSGRNHFHRLGGNCGARTDARRRIQTGAVDRQRAVNFTAVPNNPDIAYAGFAMNSGSSYPSGAIWTGTLALFAPLRWMGFGRGSDNAEFNKFDLKSPSVDGNPVHVAVNVELVNRTDPATGARLSSPNVDDAVLIAHDFRYYK